MNQDLSNHGITEQPFTPIEQESWTRNPEWTAMPTVLPTEQKVVALVRVDPGTANYLAVTCGINTGGTYTVDWGDGNITTHASVTQANKQYDFAAVPGTPTSGGYKMVLVTITPTTGGSAFASVEFFKRHSSINANVIISSGILDLIISAPNSSTITICTGATTVTHNFCERVQILSTNTTNLTYLFYAMAALRSAYVKSTGAVNATTYMFFNCRSLLDVNLSTTSFAAVTNASFMFGGCYSLVSAPDLNLPALTDGSNMFYQCTSLRIGPNITFPSSVGITSLTLASIFAVCTAMVKVPAYDFSRVTNANAVFFQCYSLTYVPDFNFSRATNFTNLFGSCYALASVGNITTTTQLTNCTSMFASSGLLKTVPLFETSAVTTMSSMFNGCSRLTSVPSYNTASVTTFQSMFQNCTSLREVPAFNYSSANTLTSMFSNCYSLVKINGTSIAPTTAVTTLTMTSAFQNCYALTVMPTLTISTNNNVVSTATAFNNAYALQSLSLNVAAVTTQAQIANIVTGSGSLRSLLLTGLRFGALTIAANLDQAALVALFTSLGTASGAQTLTVSSCTGWASLTAGDKAIATGKGWTLA